MSLTSSFFSNIHWLQKSSKYPIPEGLMMYYNTWRNAMYLNLITPLEKGDSCSNTVIFHDSLATTGDVKTRFSRSFS